MFYAGVKRYCENYEEIENYNEALHSDEMWECHHRLETHNSDGEPRAVQLSKAELQALGVYWHRPPEEFIFLTRSEHLKLHMTKERRKKLSESCKVMENSGMFVKGHKMADETKKEISKTLAKQRAVWIEFDNGYKCTTREISLEYYGKNISGAIKQYIKKYGYLVLDGQRCYCHIIEN